MSFSFKTVGLGAPCGASNISVCPSLKPPAQFFLKGILGINSLAGISDSQKIELDRRTGGLLKEFLSLERERDPEMVAEGMLSLASRLEHAGKLELAARAYTVVSESPAPPDVVRRARERLRALQGVGSAGPRAEFLFRQLSENLFDPAPLFGLAAASMVFRWTRFATLSRMLASPGAIPRLLGPRNVAGLFALGAEATAFPLATRLAAMGMGRDRGYAELSGEVGSSFLLLGAMRGVGAVPLFQKKALFRQPAMLGGILLGGQMEEWIGLRTPSDGATRLTDSLVFLLQINLAGRIARGLMGEGFRRWERVMDARADSLKPPPFFPAQGAASFPQTVRGGVLLPSPLFGEKARDSLSFMTADHPGSSRPAPRTNLIRWFQQLEKVEDPRVVETALRLFYIGTLTPLRQRVFETIVGIQEGRPIPALLAALYRDPEMRKTRFFSPEAEERFFKQIEDNLPEYGPDGEISFSVVGRRNSEIVRFLKGPFEPLNLHEDRLILDILRFNELSQVGASSSRRLSGKTALAEMNALGKNFVENIRGMIQNSDLDFLTGFLNRRGLERIRSKLEHRLIPLQRFSLDQRLSDYVLMVDIDRFKRINDTHGHDVGDEVLRAVARVIKEGVRHRDIRARFGGEEFLVYLTKAGKEGARKAAENVRTAVEQTPIILAGQAEPIFVTVSIGAAEMRMIPSGGENFTPEGAMDHAVKRADEALYTAKNNGRNQVQFSDQ